jgi:Fic family protein
MFNFKLKCNIYPARWVGPVGHRGLLTGLSIGQNDYIGIHKPHPLDIERAMSHDYSADKTKRDLQLEAVAHVNVQSWIDAGGLKNRATTRDGIMEIHRRFCENLPNDLLHVEDPVNQKQFPVVPGELRTSDVQVGRLVPISPGAVSRFLDRYEQVYSTLGISELLLATAAGHHRLLWIHPFIDGNGRVARLLSHAQLLEILNTGAVWSISRGLARRESEYKQLLVNCDHQRWNDLDGRGNLSEEALCQFTKFFLLTCLDQVKFMESLVQPERLRDRIVTWARDESKKNALLPNASAVLEAVLFRGELPRSSLPNILGLGERQAPRVVSIFIQRGVLVSDTDRAPLRLAFPAVLAPHWMPGLFPDQT